MNTDYKDLTQDISANLAQLRKTQPDVMKGFGDMGKAAMAGGALDPKALARLGATTQEVHEALGVAIYMGGGPVAMYAANAVAAFNEFSELQRV
jgi:alkylhydroperoxidase/carboxymuconolactone decarboxylase family protein YurZ